MQVLRNFIHFLLAFFGEPCYTVGMKTAGYFPDAAQRKGRMHMIRLIDSGVTIHGGKPVIAGAYDSDAKEKTIAAKILASHNKSDSSVQV